MIWQGLCGCHDSNMGYFGLILDGEPQRNVLTTILQPRGKDCGMCASFELRICGQIIYMTDDVRPCR